MTIVQVLLVLGKDRRCVWGSLFLDHNGEEDRNLRRGKVAAVHHPRVLSAAHCLSFVARVASPQTLFLNAARAGQLRKLIATNSFCFNTKILSNTSRRDGPLY
jgi:hypothetical protein